MKRINNLLFVMLTLIIITLITTTGVAKITWNGNSNWPPNNHHSVFFEEFAQTVKERTNGELEIIVNTGAALGFSGPDLMKAVKDHLVPISEIIGADAPGNVPTLGVTLLPFIHNNLDEVRFYMDLARPLYDKIAKEWNQKILYTSPWPLSHLWSQKKIFSVADVKGIKTRTYDNNGAMVIKAAGGTPLALPFGEVYSALSTGLIDSVVTSAPTAVDAKFWEKLDYCVPINLTASIDFISVNLNAFNSLDKNIQDILIKTGEEWDQYTWENIKRIDKECFETCKANGIEILPVSDDFKAELVKISENWVEKWSKEAPERAVGLYEKYMEEKKGIFK